MRQIVRETFIDINVPKEGWVPYLYADVKGWVTHSVGVLADDCRTLTPPASVLSLPWMIGPGAPATTEAIRADWMAVALSVCESVEGSRRRTGKAPVGDPLVCAWKGTSRASECMAHRGHLRAKMATRCRLTDEGVRQVTMARLDSMWAHLARRFPDLQDAPADAQHGVLSMAWALGPGWAESSWPKFTAAVRAGDWDAAALQCKLRETDNPGVKVRNIQNRRFFEEAAKTLREGRCLDEIYAWSK